MSAYLAPALQSGRAYLAPASPPTSGTAPSGPVTDVTILAAAVCVDRWIVFPGTVRVIKF